MTSSPRRDPRTQDRRRQPRYPARALNCPLGELRDLSVTGMRIVSTHRLPVQRSTVLQFTIRNDYQRILVCGRVARVRRIGLRRFEVGIAFVGVEPATTRALETLARFGYYAKEPSPGNPSGRPAGAFPGAEESPAGAGTSAARVSAAMPDLYALLNVTRDASAEVIRRAYRDMARKYHPDASRNGDTAKLFQLIHDAYKTLRDPQARKAYDTVTNARAAYADR